MILARAILFIFLFESVIFSSGEDAMTRYIVDQVLVFAKNSLPGQCPDTIIPVKSENAYREMLSGDTLYVPRNIWGFKTTNNYSLHFYTALVLFSDIFSKHPGMEESPRDFFFNSGKASDITLQYLNTLERDRIINDLLIYNYAFLPYQAARPDIIISRDYRNDSLRYFCLLKSILGYRCDTSAVEDWIQTQKFIDYAIEGVRQKPSGWKKFTIEIQLKNYGTMAVPFEIMLDYDGGDTLLRMPPVQNDRTLVIESRKSLLKVIIDPKKRLFDMNEKNQQYVSPEFTNKRKVYKICTVLIWDAVSAGIAFVLLLFLGIFIYPLTNLFYKNNRPWTAVFLVLFILIKTLLPFMFYGFNMWGFVYTMHLILNTTNMVWMWFSAVAVFSGMYYVFIKDGVRFNKLETYLKFILFAITIDPLVCSLGF